MTATERALQQGSECICDVAKRLKELDDLRHQLITTKNWVLKHRIREQIHDMTRKNRQHIVD